MIKLVSIIALVLVGYSFILNPCFNTVGLLVICLALTLAVTTSKGAQHGQ